MPTPQHQLPISPPPPPMWAAPAWVRAAHWIRTASQTYLLAFTELLNVLIVAIATQPSSSAPYRRSSWRSVYSHPLLNRRHNLRCTTGVASLLLDVRPAHPLLVIRRSLSPVFIRIGEVFDWVSDRSRKERVTTRPQCRDRRVEVRAKTPKGALKLREGA